MLSEIGLRLNFSISGNVHNFLEHGVEEAIDTEANVAAEWVSAGGVLLSVGALTIRHHLLFWVPFSESVLVFIVLHLLSHYRDLCALAVVELDSVLANVSTNLIIIICGCIQVISSQLESREACLSHGICSARYGLLTIVFPHYVILLLTKHGNLSAIKSEISHSNILCGQSFRFKGPSV